MAPAAASLFDSATATCQVQPLQKCARRQARRRRRSAAGIAGWNLQLIITEATATFVEPSLPRRGTFIN